MGDLENLLFIFLLGRNVDLKFCSKVISQIYFQITPYVKIRSFSYKYCHCVCVCVCKSCDTVSASQLSKPWNCLSAESDKGVFVM